MSRNSVTPLLTPLGQVVPTIEGRFRVDIYNNEDTAYEDVVRILIQATGCDVEEAMIETWEAHHFGKASVHFSTEASCYAAAAVIGTIGVKTEVTKEWDD